MRYRCRICVLALLTSLCVPVRGIERVPIEDFAREPEVSNAKLSPDGRHYAFVAEHSGRSKLIVSDVDHKKIFRIGFGQAALLNGVNKQAGRFEWVNDHRLMVHTHVWELFWGVLATERDGSLSTPISGYEDDTINAISSRTFAREIVHRFLDPNGTVLMLDRNDVAVGNVAYPDLLRVNSKSGLSSVILKNPGKVSHWVLDFDGVPRFGILADRNQSGAIYREDETSPWRTILPLEEREGELRLAGFDAANNRLLVTMLNAEKRWAIFPLDPATGRMGEPLVSDPVYDIVPDEAGRNEGIALAKMFFSAQKRSLVGIRYYAEVPRVKWFDREFAGYQRAVDRVLPDTVNVLTGMSANEQQMLWFAYSDQDPGTYYLMDHTDRSFKPLASRMSWLKPAQMARTLSIKYTARDGLTIHGYLTVPLGYEPKGLPLVVMPHGGPWVRDVWGFDPEVQLLANRGYAVLQMNYRGSPGYGNELFRKARQQIGREIQSDIEDGTLWAIAAGVADPARIAIMGGSYGGYSALFALGKSPELYRCGISFAGVSDWLALYADSETVESREAKSYWRDQVGDPATDEAGLRAISPVNFADQIKAPLLIIQGRKDRIVPQSQAKRMITALEKAGRPPQSLFLADTGHNYGTERRRIEAFTAIVKFLEKHLGPGVK